MIHRAQLHELITDRFGPGVTVRTGVTVTGISQDDSGVTVSSADEEFRAELVIAADGIRSVPRSAIHPAYKGPRYSGYTAYRGIADVDLSDGGGETWGRGQRFGFAKLIDGRIYWYATANRDAGLPPGPGGPHADVTSAFSDWHEPIPRLLAGTPPEQVLQNDIYDLALPLVPFVTGRVVLLGDAAHAMTPNLGRGACSAIEDAQRLARHLAPQDVALAEALRGYDAERRPVTAKLVKQSRMHRPAADRSTTGCSAWSATGCWASAARWPGCWPSGGGWNNRRCEHSSAGRRDPRCQAPALRQGPGPVRAGVGRAADGRERPDERLRLDPGDADPGQGQGADRDEPVVVRAARTCRTTSCRPTYRPRSPVARWSARSWRCSRSSASPAGYLSGSGLLDYNATGEVCGIPLRPGLVEGSRLDEPIFTPATKADLGEHDENVSYDAVVATVGVRDRRGAAQPHPRHLHAGARDRPSSAGSSWLTRSSSSAPARTARSCSPTRC